MDKGFQSLLLTGKYGVGDRNFPPISTSDDTFITRSMSSHTRTYDKSVLPSLIYPYSSISSYGISDGNIHSAMSCEISTEYSREMELKRLKTEPSSESFSFNLNPTILFSQLPELRSMEQVNQTDMRFRHKFLPEAATSYNQHMYETPLTNYLTPAPPLPLPPPAKFQLTMNNFSPLPPPQLQPRFPPPAKLSGKERELKRRHTISDKARSLQNLLPADKKMTTATIYEETYKYITFLKAQIAVLESMPVSSSSSSMNFRSGNPRYGGLENLNRQQLLEVSVNSPATQSVLSSRGCCIYSLEQLMLFNDVVQKSFFFSDH